MKVYIAGPWAHRGDMPEIAKAIEEAGAEITWKWWEVEDVKEGPDSHSKLLQMARDDYVGVANADLLVLINSAMSEGKSFEQGIATTLDKPIIAVGKRGEHSKNVFHYLYNYFWVDTVTDAANAVRLLTWALRNASK